MERARNDIFSACIVSKPWLINIEGKQDKLCPSNNYFLGNHTGSNPEVQVRGDRVQGFSMWSFITEA